MSSLPLVGEGAPAEAAAVGSDALPSSSGGVAQPSSDPVSLAAELAGTSMMMATTTRMKNWTSPHRMNCS